MHADFSKEPTTVADHRMPTGLMYKRMTVTSRVLQIVACALLVFDLSGAAALTADEGCRPGTTNGAHDVCSPSCLRCACCVQPLDATPAVSAGVHLMALMSFVPPLIVTATPGPAEIFHVPRSI
jgi:hypothetical protein